MEFGFLFFLFGIGILTATFQDLKRREVDDWLNYLLLVSGFIYVVFYSINFGEYSYLINFFMLFVLLFGIVNLFYYGQIFAGGDAKLLLSLCALFVTGTFVNSLINLGTFLLFLFFSGSIYGLFYISILYSVNFKKINKILLKKYGFYFIICLIGFFGLFLVLGIFYNSLFLLVSFLFLFPLLLDISKKIEEFSMVRQISGDLLKEGDWIAQDILVGKKLVKSNFEGLSVEEVKLLRKLKKVKIKEGIPFVPAFLLAFIFYYFFKDFFLSIF